MTNLESKPLKRNFLIDNIKGIAIFLVVWGHSIQFLGSNEYDFFGNKVFTFLYAFHMPLFMFVSGYLFTNSPKKKTLYEISKTKFNELIVPLLLWNIIFTIVFYGKRLLNGVTIENCWFLIQKYFEILPYYLWFFWTLFICMLLTVIVARRFGNKPWIFALSILLLLLIPDFSLLKYIKFLFPYFVAGYLYNHYSRQILNYKSILLFASVIIFIGGIAIWDTNYFIYNTGMSLYVDHLNDRFSIIIIRYTVGFAGTFLFITLLSYFRILRVKSWLSKIGTNTYGIYVLQTLLLPIFGKVVKLDTDDYVLYNFIYTPVLAVTTILLSLIIIKLIEVNKFSHKYLLGAR